MVLYATSPKKTNAGYGSQRWSEVKRKIVLRRYLCLWVLLALVPCYMLRQMFSSSSPRLSTSSRQVEIVARGKMASEKPVDENYEVSDERLEKPEKPMPKEDETIPLPRAVNVFREEGKPEKKQEEEKVQKVAKREKKTHERKTKKSNNSKSLSDHSLEKFDGDFGVPEDNEKEEEQNWQAPPAPIKKPTNVEESRRYCSSGDLDESSGKNDGVTSMACCVE